MVDAEQGDIVVVVMLLVLVLYEEVMNDFLATIITIGRWKVRRSQRTKKTKDTSLGCDDDSLVRKVPSVALTPTENLSVTSKSASL